MAHLHLWISGVQHRLKSVELYSEERVAEWRSLTNRGLQQLAPQTAGIGLLGSPGWVAAGAFALGALESALTSVAQKDGLSLLREADRLLSRLRSEGRFVAVSAIQGLKEPSPASWRGRAEESEIVDPRRLTRAEAAERAKRPFVLGSQETEVVERPYTTYTGDFISAEVEDEGTMMIRWPSVDAWRLGA